jgi:hypothetical protein
VGSIKFNQTYDSCDSKTQGLGDRRSLLKLVFFVKLSLGADRMEAFQKNIAVTRGEALAAHLLASAALQAVFGIVADKQQMLKAIGAMIDDTLNSSGPAKGDTHDEFNMLIRETARNQIDQTLTAIARGLTSSPPPSK